MAAPHLPSGHTILVPNQFLSLPQEQQIVERYRKFRLYSLQVDPQAFSSTYDDESQFPYDTWLSRIQNPAGKTFVSLGGLSTEAEEISKSNNPDSLDGTKSSLGELLSREWVGIVTLIGPGVFLKPNDDSPTVNKTWEVFIQNGRYQIPLAASKSDDLQGAHLVYLVVGMFVSPSARRRGHGRRLLEATIEAAAEESAMLGASKTSITVQVETVNPTALPLYESLGFHVTEKIIDIQNRQGIPSQVVSLEKEIELPKL
ncbi:hypothetical protein N7462_005562 [Penicillium macrosclerotiorum]|uniref:uncharacterized protein n=1 Tax=Penicillium macrosclerotiorum TaxID=303699 RepID=UPI0025491E7A|nr:uncharacterized protein N7462_005562 [Penicillium macrosclerotiorum]KAJ5682397.1 hypothetical protein N7462_005562 [Penicillium macrosclerotiorum]